MPITVICSYMGPTIRYLVKYGCGGHSLVCGNRPVSPATKATVTTLLHGAARALYCKEQCLNLFFIASSVILQSTSF